MHKPPLKSFEMLTIGESSPYRSIPTALERMIHFSRRIWRSCVRKEPGVMAPVDALLGNLENAIPAACDIRAVARKPSCA